MSTENYSNEYKNIAPLKEHLEKNNETFFKYSPKKKFKHKNKENMKENPFKILKNLNLS